jgi:hypothetical protein
VKCTKLEPNEAGYFDEKIIFDVEVTTQSVNPILLDVIEKDEMSTSYYATFDESFWSIVKRSGGVSQTLSFK